MHLPRGHSTESWTVSDSVLGWRPLLHCTVFTRKRPEHRIQCHTFYDGELFPAMWICEYSLKYRNDEIFEHNYTIRIKLKVQTFVHPLCSESNWELHSDELHPVFPGLFWDAISSSICKHIHPSVYGFSWYFLVSELNESSYTVCLKNVWFFFFAFLSFQHQIYIPFSSHHTCCGTCQNVSCSFHTENGTLIVYEVSALEIVINHNDTISRCLTVTS